MKKKAALLLAILALGVLMAACSQSGTSETAPTATPEATEKPAEPTATPEAESSADDDEPASHEELVGMITEELGYTEEEAEELIQKVVELDEADQASLGAAKAASDEEFIQDYVEFGYTREEAEAKLEEIERRGTAARIERGVRNQISHVLGTIRMEQDRQDAHAERDKFCWENYGTSADHWDSMTTEEQLQWKADHPMN